MQSHCVLLVIKALLEIALNTKLILLMQKSKPILKTDSPSVEIWSKKWDDRCFNHHKLIFLNWKRIILETRGEGVVPTRRRGVIGNALINVCSVTWHDKLLKLIFVSACFFLRQTKEIVLKEIYFYHIVFYIVILKASTMLITHKNLHSQSIINTYSYIN